MPAAGPSVRRLDAVSDLASGLSMLKTACAGMLGETVGLHRVEVPLTGTTDPLALPAGFPDGVLDPLMLLGPTWSGAGAAIEHEAHTLAGITALDLGGGNRRFALTARFDPDRGIAPEWTAFGRCRVWLPAIELDTEVGLLAANWSASRELEPLVDALDRWRPAALSEPDARAVSWRTNGSTRRTWCDSVSAALDRIADTETQPRLHKIVLARRLDGELTNAVHPADLIGSRLVGNVGWPWWLQRDGWSWLGETPEVLGVRENTTLRSMALAGTRPRSDDPEQDAALGQDLLTSDKDRREQAAVAEWLRGRLAELTGHEPTVGDLELIRLPSVQHLSRTLDVAWNRDVTDGVWLDALHPTPALCGSPRVDVRAWLRRTETFDRGLYGGVVGWLEPSRAEMHVAIRGLALRDRRVSVYAGAGLVRGSSPDLEWAETGAKVAAVCRRLGLQPPRRDDQ